MKFYVFKKKYKKKKVANKTPFCVRLIHMLIVMIRFHYDLFHWIMMVAYACTLMWLYNLCYLNMTDNQRRLHMYIFHS